MRHYVTYCDIGYAARALVLADSLHKHEAHPYELIVVCFDELTRLVMEKVAPGNVSTIPLHKVEERFPELHRCREERTRQEYCWTLSAPCLYYVLESRDDIEIMIYSDADCAFWSDPQPVFDEIGEASVMIHEHRFQKSMYRYEDPNKYGKYNVGLMAFRRNVDGLKVLKWWTEKNIEWCKVTPEDGKFGDQKYLDDWPERFENLHVLQTKVAGAAPWNHQKYSFGSTAQGPTIDGEALVHYHFHALKIWDEHSFVPLNVDYELHEDCIESIYFDYMSWLMSWREKLHTAFPGIRPEQSVGGAPSAVLNDLVLHRAGDSWHRTTLRHQALLEPRSIEHLFESFERSVRQLTQGANSEEVAMFFELRAKFSNFILHFAPNDQQAETIAKRIRPLMPIIWMIDSNVDPNMRLINSKILRNYQRTRLLSNRDFLVGALYDNFLDWALSMRAALFGLSWQEWMFTIVNSDMSRESSRYSVQDIEEFRINVLNRFGEFQKGAPNSLGSAF